MAQTVSSTAALPVARPAKDRHLLLVAPHFPPSSLTAAHRPRYLATHLPSCGWNVRVLSVLPSFYEGAVEPELNALVPSSVDVIRTPALPTSPIRLIGDMGLRAFPWHLAAILREARRTPLDLLYITMWPFYSALLGPLVRARTGVPYALDYQDPWVHAAPGARRPFSKAWATIRLARLLEPIALRHVSVVSGVAPGYFEGALRRSPWLDPQRCIAAPLGAEDAEFSYLDRYPRPPYLFDPSDGRVHLVYAGAMLPRAYDSLATLFRALSLLKSRSPELTQGLQVHFIGTGLRPGDTASHAVAPVAERLGVSDHVQEHPRRIPFLDVLNHLRHASGVLILGSDEPHYSPSKVFQALLSGRPVLPLLHRASTAVSILEECYDGPVVRFDAEHPVSAHVEEVAAHLASLARGDVVTSVDHTALQRYSTLASAQRIAQAFDRWVA